MNNNKKGQEAEEIQPDDLEAASGGSFASSIGELSEHSSGVFRDVERGSVASDMREMHQSMDFKAQQEIIDDSIIENIVERNNRPLARSNSGNSKLKKAGVALGIGGVAGLAAGLADLEGLFDKKKGDSSKK